jgi:hypothetical protein
VASTRTRFFSESFEENPREEDPILNRPFCIHSISPVTDPRRSEILYALVESGLALGKQEAAQKALGRLLKEFPYSEAAAKAKDRWVKK